MGSISKRQKLSEQQYGDRISNLPNSLIAQILSRLPTKYAVSTSALSKRWREQWTSITSFDIDDGLFLCPQNKSTDPSMQTSFTSFVHRVLLHHASCVEKFRLKCCESYDSTLVNGWIAFPLLRNVRELDLNLVSDQIEHPILLPRDLFTCRTLVVLKLSSRRFWDNYRFMSTLPTPVSLPSLRILHLGGVEFEDDDSINRLLFGCPVLEDLSLRRCSGGSLSVINIVAPRLTSLFIQECWFGHAIRPSWPTHECKFVLHAPALLYLTIHAKNGCSLVGENILHVIRADIKCYSAKALTDLIKEVSNVQFLQLDFPMEDSDMHQVQVPKFPNMTCLEIGYAVGCEYLVELLENSPHLETLVFKQDFGDDCEGFTKLLQSPARNVPSCLLFHLKVIEFRDFGGLPEDWEMVHYFLKNAKVLEKVDIVYGDGGAKWTIHASRT